MLQATRNSVWGGTGGGEWRWGLAWPPEAHVPEILPIHMFRLPLTFIPSPCAQHNTGIQLSAICNPHLFSLKLIRFAFGLPVSACWTWDCLSSRRRSTPTSLLPSSAPSSKPKNAVQRANKDWRALRDALEYTSWFNRKQSPLQQDGSAPQSSGEKASALTQTYELWGEGTPYST